MTVRLHAAVLLAGCFAIAGLGCASHRVVQLDAQNPAVRCAMSGVYFGNDRVEISDVPEILEDYDIPHDRVIHIRLDPDVKDLREARALMVDPLR